MSELRSRVTPKEIRLTFAMTINRSQGQSLGAHEIMFEFSCSTHVACSPSRQKSVIDVYLHTAKKTKITDIYQEIREDLITNILFGGISEIWPFYCSTKVLDR